METPSRRSGARSTLVSARASGPAQEQVGILCLSEPLNCLLCHSSSWGKRGMQQISPLTPALGGRRSRWPWGCGQLPLEQHFGSQSTWSCRSMLESWPGGPPPKVSHGQSQGDCSGHALATVSSHRPRPGVVCRGSGFSLQASPTRALPASEHARWGAVGEGLRPKKIKLQKDAGWCKTWNPSLRHG